MMRYCYMVLLLCLSLPFGASAQSVDVAEQSVRYSVQIDIDRAGISGVCILREEGDMVLGAIINEFGVSALTFSYNTRRERAKIVDVIPQLDKWYIKRVLRRDLKTMIPQIAESGVNIPYEYLNVKYKIRYRFTPLSLKE